MRAVPTRDILCLLLVLAPCSSCGRFGFELNKVESGGDSGTPVVQRPDMVEGEPRSDAQAQSTTVGLDGGTAGDAGTEAGTSDSKEGGVNSPDAGTEGKPPDPLASSVIHHYAFDGMGTSATDGSGSAHGTLVGATLDGMGGVALSGGVSGPHVVLPAGIVSSLESVTVEAWLTWTGGGGYQRVFDFGNSTGGAGAQGAGTRFFSLATNGNGNTLRLVFDVDPSTGSAGWRTVSSSPVITTLMPHQLVAVFDRGQNRIRLYVDGEVRGSAAVPVGEDLSDIDDVNAWLGMGQWTADPTFAGTLHDVRLYNVPLSDADVRLRFQLGYE